MNHTVYLVDTNALSVLTRPRIKSHFFKTYCRVTADVIREVPTHPDRALLEANAIQLTPAVLVEVRAVMSTVQPGDTSLVDLYGNKGMADPGLIASARAAAAQEEGKLFGDVWVIVTNDVAVGLTATRHFVPTIKPAALAALIDESLC